MLGRNIELIRYFGIGILAILGAILSSCGMTENFRYVSRGDLAYDPLYLMAKPEMQKTSNYGAIKFTPADANDNEGNLYVLQKRHGVYQAETMFKQSKNKKYYFSFGMNYREKQPAIGFRMEF